MRLLFFISGFFLVMSNAFAGVTEKDSLALVALYDSTDGVNWTNTWDLNTPVETWYGITVTNNNVTRINFSQNNLAGHLPPQIGNLDSLEYLRLYWNTNLVGNIPSEIGNLSKLQNLDLNNNRFTGEIPVTIGNLDSLMYINIDQSNLTGDIPEEILNCKKLQSLRMISNSLSGLPDLSSLTELNDVWISDNSFSGPFPTFFYNMPQIVSLNISNNEFDGELSADIAKLQQLRTFYFAGNNLSGAIPPEIGTMDRVTFLELYNNNFEGEIPPELGNMNDLRFLRLHGNQLTGTIPEHLASLKNLNELNLGNNQLSGTIPDSIGYIVNLNEINLVNNNLEGTLPSTFSNLINLKEVYLSGNNFTGSINGLFDNASGIERFYIDNNHFEGAIPDSFVHFESLRWMYINGNKLSHLPSFADHQMLQVLDIRNNAFTFEDIEPQLVAENLSNFFYIPQDSVGNDTTILREIGDSFTASVNIGGAANHYQWFFNSVMIDSATESSITISPIAMEDYGDYTCQVSSDSVTDLILYSNPITLQEGTPSAIDEVGNNLPGKFELSQNYPNPFNPVTKIEYALPKAAHVKIDVFNMLGQHVIQLQNKREEAGYHSINFDGGLYSSGVYFYTFDADGHKFRRKMLLIK